MIGKRDLMQPGLELDYSLGGVLWIPARVECLVKEENVCIRFAIGWGQEVLHVLDPLSLSRLVAPAGTYTIPLLAGQPVDFLRRMPAAPSFPACEQWLAGASCPINRARTPPIGALRSPSFFFFFLGG